MQNDILSINIDEQYKHIVNPKLSDNENIKMLINCGEIKYPLPSKPSRFVDEEGFKLLVLNYLPSIIW